MTEKHSEILLQIQEGFSFTMAYALEEIIQLYR